MKPSAFSPKLRLGIWIGLLGLASGCAPVPELIRDVRTLDQNALSYAASPTAYSLLVHPAYQKRINTRFDSLYFAIWHKNGVRLSLQDAAWGFQRYGGRPTFGENKMRHTDDWWKTLADNAGLETFPNRSFRAITSANTDLRVLPTHKPLFLDFSLPGEGYPFDYLQQSSLPANTPVAVLHATRDRAWFFVDSPAAAGWVPARDVAAVDSGFAHLWENGTVAVALQDEVPVKSPGGRFLFYAPFGSVFPFVELDGPDVRVLAVVPDAEQNAAMTEAVLPGSAVTIKPLPLTASNLARAVNALMGEPYGWGGMYMDRDCSAAVKDLFAPFGLFLPRNSAAQAAAGDSSVELGSLSPEAKERVILEQGIPFLTLIHLKGHIMLYIGKWNGRAIVFHNLWGVRTKSFWGKEGRKIVGRAVITTLSPGRELGNADHSAEILGRIDRITFLIPPDSVIATARKGYPTP